ncbi:invasion associated locus B family protein [Phreatobacter sp.]|uniref:invasion associated locus B family protein n=1 Tax=Phreatobacter sp. TaxID=1966341 RepID=UPI003F71C106
MPLIRQGRLAALFAIVLASAASFATAQPLTGQNRVVATHGDWRVVVAETNRGRVCYAAGAPGSREPGGVVRGRGFLFVTTRPGDAVRDEVSVEFGFDLAGRPVVAVAEQLFDLAIEGQTAWIRQLAEEARMVVAMRKARQLAIRSVSALGEETIDSYSLVGFGPALDVARRHCTPD